MKNRACSRFGFSTSARRADVTVDLISLQSMGSGKTKLALDRLSPVKSLITMDSLVNMNIPDNGTNKLMKMTSKLQIKIEPPAADKKK